MAHKLLRGNPKVGGSNQAFPQGKSLTKTGASLHFVPLASNKLDVEIHPPLLFFPVILMSFKKQFTGGQNNYFISASMQIFQTLGP